MAATYEAPVLEVIDLSLRYQTRQGEVRAVEGVSFGLAQGQSLGLVGESGCGKTSVANCLMRLLPENARLAGGEVQAQWNRPVDRWTTRRCAATAGVASPWCSRPR